MNELPLGRPAPSSSSRAAARPRATRPLRVGMITSLFAPSIGGIQSHTLRLSQALVARGVEVHVLTRAGPGLPAFERMGGVRVHRAGIGRATGAAGSVAFMAAAVPALLRLAPELDVLHAHQLLSPTTVGLLARPLCGLPLVLNPHACGSFGDVGQLSASAVGRVRLRAAVAYADAFVAVSRTIRDELVTAGARPEAVHLLGNGVDTDRCSPAAPAERAALRRVLGLPGGPLCVYAGRLAREKGPDVLVAAWREVARAVPGARALLLGTGAEEGALRAEVARLGLADRVILQGGVPDVAPYLRAADAAVLPSRTEGMPVALLEAMACALPTVATRVGGSAEVLQDGVTGRLVAPEDPAALAAGVVEALTSQAPASGWGAAARAHVLAHASMDAVAERFLALYARLVARRPFAVVPAP